MSWDLREPTTEWTCQTAFWIFMFLSRKPSLCLGRTSHVSEISDYWVPSLKLNIDITPPRLKKHCKRRSRKYVEKKDGTQDITRCLVDLTWPLYSWTWSIYGSLHMTCARLSQQTTHNRQEKGLWGHTPRWGVIGWWVLGSGNPFFQDCPHC